MLAGAEQFLGEQVAEAAGPLDRPRAFLEAVGPLEQLGGLAPTGADLHLGELNLAVVDRYRRVRSLVGSIPIITVTVISFSSFGWTAAGTPDSRCWGASLF